jgi:hypothetical protein
MDGWMDGWMDEWVGGWMDGWMDGKPSDCFKKQIFSSFIKQSSLKLSNIFFS